MSFQFFDPANIEFGVCRGSLLAGQFAIVPVDKSVKSMLEQMVTATRAELGLDSTIPDIPSYELSERYPSESPLSLPLSDPLAEKLKSLVSAGNIATNAKALDDVRDVTAYFCIVHDRAGGKMLAIRRAAQFKGMLKRRFVRVFNETLEAITDTVFQLDSDFDLLVVDDTVYILRPTAFEHLADIDAQILTQAGKNTAALDAIVPGIGFSTIAPYVSRHKRAARIVASLLRRDDLREITVASLRRACRLNSIPVDSSDGALAPLKGQELAFLNLLDRRRYVVSLIPRKHEQYEAGSRKNIGIRARASQGQAEAAAAGSKGS